ncbi:hypothetical protein C0J52_01615, partial [Blattella germanica]
ISVLRHPKVIVIANDDACGENESQAVVYRNLHIILKTNFTSLCGIIELKYEEYFMPWQLFLSANKAAGNKNKAIQLKVAAMFFAMLVLNWDPYTRGYSCFVVCKDSRAMGFLNNSTIELIHDEETDKNKWGGTKRNQLITTLTAGLLSLTYGCGTGWLSPTLPLLQTPNNITGIYSITEDESSWLSSLPFLGAIAASPIFSFICQYYGRKTAGYLSAVPAIVSWAIIAAADSMVLLYAARFLIGVTYGGIVVFKPMYIGEIAEDSIRGGLGSFLPLLCNLATLFTYSLGPFVSIRTLAITCLAVPMLFVFGFYWLPETPTYLISKGKVGEAAKAMLWLRGGNMKVAERDLQKVKDLLLKRDTTDTTRNHVKELFFSRGTIRAITVCLVICIAQQFSGVYVVLSYCNDIMAMATTEISPEIAGIAVGVTQFLGSFMSIFFMDSLGRKTLLLGSQIVMAICLGCLGTYYYFQNLGADMTSVAFLPVICVSVYLFSIGFGIAPVTYVLISELFHPDIRGIVTTIVTTNIWTLAFLVTKLYPLLLGLLEMHGCYWAFASVCVICMIYTIFQIPETKSRSLESILQELNSGKRNKKSSYFVNV